MLFTSYYLGNTYYLSKSQFPHLKYRDSGSDLRGLFWGVRLEDVCEDLACAWHTVNVTTALPPPPPPG